MSPLLPVADALAAVLARAEALPREQVLLEAAAGRILADSVASIVDLPPFPSSSMDGYAVRAADVPGTLRIVGRVAAGRPETRLLREGEAIEISTGGVVPGGADTVVPVERVVARPDEIEISEATVQGDNIRRQGGDVHAGDQILGAGDLLTPARLAALAACGIESVMSRRRPSVAVVVTGTELRAPGEPLAPGQIYESNGIMLATALADVGARVERFGATEDKIGRAHV